MDPRYIHPQCGQPGQSGYIQWPQPEELMPQQQLHNPQSFQPTSAYAAPAPFEHHLNVRQPPAPTMLAHHYPTTLPQPSQILRSQPSPSPCLVCSKLGCTLTSHKAFAQSVISATKTKPGPRTGSVAGSGHVTPSHATIPVQQTPLPHMSTSAERDEQMLLDLWSQPWGHQAGPQRHLFPERYIDKIIPYATKHPPLFQASMSIAVSFRSLAQGSLDEVALTQMQHAIQHLLRASPGERAASADECILAAIFIMMSYVLSGDVVESDRHLSGINQLVDLRGGPHYLGMSGVIVDALFYVDHLQAINFDREPHWPLPLPALSVGPPSKFGRGFGALAITGELDVSVARASVSLCELMDVFRYTGKSGTMPPNVLNSTGYLTTVNEYQLARCNAMFHGTTSVNECVCLAFLLINQLVLRDYGAITPVIRKLEYQLFTTFERCDALGVWARLDPRVLIWLLFTALTIRFRADCRWEEMAYTKLRRARQAAKINTWDELKIRVLDVYAWLDVAQDESFRKIWTELDETSAG